MAKYLIVLIKIELIFIITAKPPKTHLYGIFKKSDGKAKIQGGG